jgi:hypothetical protein
MAVGAHYDQIDAVVGGVFDNLRGYRSETARRDSMPLVTIGGIEQRLEALPNLTVHIAFDFTAAPIRSVGGRAERMPDDMKHVQGGVERVGQLPGILEGAR